MRKVLFIACYFPPAGGSGVQRALRFVQYLPARGYLPIVVSGPASPNDRWAPSDASLSALIPSDVAVHEVSQAIPGSDGALRGRLERWLALESAFGKWWIPAAVDLGCRVGKEADLIFATMSPFESGEAARQTSQRLGIPWVADLRDPWALDDTQIYPSLLHRRVEMARMEHVLSTASLVIMNTAAASAALTKAFPSLRGKPILTITNGFDREDFAFPVSPRSDSKFRIVHSGGMLTDSGMQLQRRSFYRLLGGVEKGVNILTRSPKVLLDAMDLWCGHLPEIKNDVEIIFAGKTTEEDRNVAGTSPISQCIRFTGFLSHRESLSLIRTADLLFLPMHNLPPGTPCRSVPGKTFEYMASSRPILAAVPDGDAREFMTQCGTGLVCRPDDVAGMTRILDLVYSSWKDGESVVSSNSEYVRQFDRQDLTRSLAAAFNRVIGQEQPTDLENDNVTREKASASLSMGNV
jgi:glycosyltransferase involved in cell wall biosynthesis